MINLLYDLFIDAAEGTFGLVNLFLGAMDGLLGTCSIRQITSIIVSIIGGISIIIGCVTIYQSMPLQFNISNPSNITECPKVLDSNNGCRVCWEDFAINVETRPCHHRVCCMHCLPKLRSHKCLVCMNPVVEFVIIPSS
jgi:hypothetical protein